MNSPPLKKGGIREGGLNRGFTVRLKAMTLRSGEVCVAKGQEHMTLTVFKDGKKENCQKNETHFKEKSKTKNFAETKKHFLKSLCRDYNAN